MRLNITPLPFRVPSSDALSSLNCILSQPIMSQISSTTVSTAKQTCGEPGARYAADFGLLTTTSYASMREFATSYAALMQLMPAVNDEPG